MFDLIDLLIGMLFLIFIYNLEKIIAGINFIQNKIINWFDFISIKFYKIEKKLGSRLIYISLLIFTISNVYFFFEISTEIPIINLILLILAYKWKDKIIDSESYSSLELTIFIAFPLIYILYNILPDEKFFGLDKIDSNDLLRFSGIITSLYLIYYLWNENWFFGLLLIIHIISTFFFHLSYIFEKHMGINGIEEIEKIGGFEQMWKINNKFERFIFHAIPLIALTRKYIYMFILGVIYLPEALKSNEFKESHYEEENYLKQSSN